MALSGNKQVKQEQAKWHQQHMYTHTHTHTCTHSHAHTPSNSTIQLYSYLYSLQKQQFLDYISANMPHIKQSNTYKILHVAYSQLLLKTNLYFNYLLCTCANGISIFAVLYVLLNLMEWLVHFQTHQIFMHLQQSRVKFKHYSVVYFNHITMLEALQCTTFVKGGAHSAV